jgi:hypothetical protein
MFIASQFSRPPERTVRVIARETQATLKTEAQPGYERRSRAVPKT